MADYLSAGTLSAMIQTRWLVELDLVTQTRVAEESSGCDPVTGRLVYPRDCLSMEL